MPTTFFVTFPSHYGASRDKLHPNGGDYDGYVTVRASSYGDAIEYAQKHLVPYVNVTTIRPTDKPRGELFCVDLNVRILPAIQWKDLDMTKKRNRKDVEREIAAITARLANLQEELETAVNLPKDEYAVGTVIRFNVQFTAGGTVYKYAAVKFGNFSWSVTGERTDPVSWDKLVEIMLEDYAVKNSHASLQFSVYSHPDTTVRVPVNQKKGC